MGPLSTIIKLIINSLLNTLLLVENDATQLTNQKSDFCVSHLYTLLQLTYLIIVSERRAEKPLSLPVSSTELCTVGYSVPVWLFSQHHTEAYTLPNRRSKKSHLKNPMCKSHTNQHKIQAKCSTCHYQRLKKYQTKAL